jgi:hypothetical protein
MARQLDEFPQAQPQDGKYPWTDWMNGHPWALVPGEDFKTKIGSMRQTCAKAAQRRGLDLKTMVMREGTTDILVVQFTDPKKTTPGRRRATRTS